ncbi:MAG: hypothetical protein ACT4ON_15855 [Bacteroidota bacterium]
MANNKNLIISLIKDDLINKKLLLGLNSLGLDPDHYGLFLSETIFALIEFKENAQSDLIYERVYLAMAERINEINLKNSKDELDVLAMDIYNELIQAKEFF